MTREKTLLTLSIILFIVALAIGLHMVWAGLNTENESDILKAKLEEQDKVTSRKIDSLHVIIRNREVVVDTLLMRGKQLEDKITQKDKEIKEAKAKVRDMTNEQIKKWILQRYKYNK